MWGGGAPAGDNGNTTWGQASDATTGWGDQEEPSKPSGWGNPSPNPGKPGKSRRTTEKNFHSAQVFSIFQTNGSNIITICFVLIAGTKSMESWGGKGDSSVAASRHASWDEEDDGGGGVWNNSTNQGNSSSFNSGGWGQTHGGKRGNMKVGN